MDINLNNVKTSAQAVTKICYNEPTRNLNYRITCKSLEDLKECVRIIRSYNEFDYLGVNKALDEYASIKRYYNVDNPNNGKDMFEFEIGREGSPVIYIKLTVFGKTLFMDKNGEEKEYTKDMFQKDMEELFKTAKADEVSFNDDGWEYECRLWWD